MQIPETPPILIADITANMPATARKLAPFMRPEFVFAHADAYLHWDEIRHRPLPKGFADHKTYWTFLKMRRTIGRLPLPLQEKSGNMFSFAAADEILEGLSEADSHLRGLVDTYEPLSQAHRDMRQLRLSVEEEAIHSSLLEGAPTTRAKAKAMLDAGRKPRDIGERMVLNNYRAMEYVREHKDEPLSEAMIFELHRVVTEGVLQDENDAGRLRGEMEDFGVWDNARNRQLFVPPPVGELPGRLRALCAFANTPRQTRPFIHPVARAIILHFQLAYDHPFADGNGRTARALFYWLMLKNGYWLTEYVSISEILRRAPNNYSRAFLFTESDDGDVSYFVLHQLRVLKVAIAKFLNHLKKRRGDVRGLEKFADNLNERQREVLLRAHKNPHWIIAVREHRRRWNITTQTARTDLQSLVRLGYLEMRVQGKAHLFYPTDKLAAL